MSPPCVDLVVDRIEAGWAVVEWCGSAVSELPLDVLPVSVAEGDRVRFSVRGVPTRGGRAVFVLLPSTPKRTEKVSHVGNPEL